MSTSAKKKSKYPCSSCGKKITSHQDAHTHPLLKTLQCSSCHSVFKLVGDLTVYRKGSDLDGKDNYCRWCLDGGDLTLCADDNCQNGFCATCIERNFGEDFLEWLGTQTDWHCFLCDYTQLDELRTKTQKIINTLNPKPVIERTPTEKPKGKISKNLDVAKTQEASSPVILETIQVPPQKDEMAVDPVISETDETPMQQEEVADSPVIPETVEPPVQQEEIADSPVLPKPVETPVQQEDIADSPVIPEIVEPPVPQEEIADSPVILETTEPPTHQKGIADSPMMPETNQQKEQSTTDEPEEKIEERAANPVILQTVQPKEKTTTEEPEEKTKEKAVNPMTLETIQQKEHSTTDEPKEKTKEPSVNPMILETIQQKDKATTEKPKGKINFEFRLFSRSKLCSTPAFQTVTREKTPPPKPKIVEQIPEAPKREDKLVDLAKELEISDESDDDHDEYVEAKETNSDIMEVVEDIEEVKDVKTDQVLEWVLRDAEIVHKRIKILMDGITYSYKTFDVDSFRKDPSNFTTWLDLADSFLGGTPTVRDRVHDLQKFLTIDD